MKFRATLGALCVASLLCGVTAARAAEQLAVLHWGTSSGEFKAIGILKADMHKQGYPWQDLAVDGGAGSAAMTALKTLVISGKVPSAAQVKGSLIQEWAKEGVLVNIDAAARGWSKDLPPQIDEVMKVKGHYLAAPFSVHRVNWLWLNKAALDKVGAQPPATWPEFFALADKLKAAGYIPVAHGGQPSQDLAVWETVVLSQGPDFYKKAIVELDPETLTSPQMVQVFDIVRHIETYFDKGNAGRDWNLATAMVINGKAGMQFTGDWAKGEFANAKQVPGKDYICSPAPGTAQSYDYNVDSFVFFQQQDQKTATPGQLALARAIMSPGFQEQFSLYKGSIPARLGVSMASFDACGQKSYADEQLAIKSGSYLPSLAHGMAQPDAMAGAIAGVVTQFMSSAQSSQDAVQDLARAAKSR